jgi:hypothetical protein
MRTRKRRHIPPIDSLGVSRCTTWLIALDNWGQILESSKIDAGTDLYVALVQESLRYHSAGWQMDERMFYNRDFYVRRRGDTPRRVCITSLDPALTRLETQGQYDRFGFEFRAPTRGGLG